MRVRCEIDDGYVGKSRPHYTDIPDEELEGLTKDEKQELIYEYVQDDFEQAVSWYIKHIEEN